MGNRTPRLSIGMPVYNGERFLREALDSVLTQTFSDFELIISIMHLQIQPKRSVKHTRRKISEFVISEIIRI